ncbi:transposable element tc3 transposase [Trichonephila inaurata madagascariensis]|uniref:Transposable element tc3 transposase n=1 Tax=Trichonephila inaurata madagascariensis TaxID=2747483 RepID=A0A8X6XX54_9ARAC|nr:transposable element tc3 transposase [Trichonephila inaurata madagascariensis]
MLSIVEEALLVKLHYKRIRKVSLRAYRYMKGMRDSKGPITSSVLNKMMKKFEATGSLVSRQRSGRPSTATAVATTVEHTVQSMSVVAAHRECSAQEVSRQTGVLYESVWRALGITLRRYPYKFPHNQELKPPDFDSRRDFVNLLFNKMEELHEWLHTVLWTDEKYFTLSGAVNTYNCRMWTTENPHAFVEVPLQQPKETVWCDFNADFIIG